MVARAGEAADFPFQISSHVLRHSCGYKLAHDGRDTRSIQHYLGHRLIASTVRYTALAPDRFKNFWEDSCWNDGAVSPSKSKGVEGKNIWVPSKDCSLAPMNG